MTEQKRWTIIGGKYHDKVEGPRLDYLKSERIEVVPADRLREVERERDEYKLDAEAAIRKSLARERTLREAVTTAVRRYRNNHIDVIEMVGLLRSALESTEEP